MIFGMSYTIHTIDLLYQDTPETIAAYLILGADAPILIETGPASTLENLKAGLANHNLVLEDIKHVLVTHIHLDHSGAAGYLAQAGAQVYAHFVGAPHLIDPSKLLASAGRIYLDQMDTLWGTTVAAPAARVTAVEDQQKLTFGDLTVTCHDTPGHAWHHMAYQLDDILFSGDALGNRLNERPYTVLPAPPPEFKLDVWLETLSKIRAINPAIAYPTHFGSFTNIPSHIEQFESLLHDASNFVLARLKNGRSRDDIVEAYKAWDFERGKNAGMNEAELHQYITSNPLHMSVDGITRYWKRKGAV